MAQPYLDVEVRVLELIAEAPTFDRWAGLCSLLCDGIYAAAESVDRDLPRALRTPCGIIRPRRPTEDASHRPTPSHE